MFFSQCCDFFYVGEVLQLFREFCQIYSAPSTSHSAPSLFFAAVCWFFSFLTALHRPAAIVFSYSAVSFASKPFSCILAIVWRTLVDWAWLFVRAFCTNSCWVHSGLC